MSLIHPPGCRLRIGIFTIGGLVCLVLPLAGIIWGQDRSAASNARPLTLTVPAGVPLHLVLQRQVPIRKVNEPVEARVGDPVFVFDHLLIPEGSRALGRVTKVESASRKQRGLAIANGNFSPLRKAVVSFDTLILKDGTRRTLDTKVTQEEPKMVHLVAGEGEKRKGRVMQALNQARQEAVAREQQTISQVKEPGEVQRIESWLWAQFPYHRPKLVAGTQFVAELRKPLEFGEEEVAPQELEHLGSDIPSASDVHVRLLTSLSSATDHLGAPVKAVVSEPVFSPKHELILPEGARLDGVVTQAKRARRLCRNGQLRFTFRQIDLGPGVAPAAPRQIQGTLQAADAVANEHVEIDPEGGAHAITPKIRFIAPAIDVFLAASSLDGLDPHNRRRIQEGRGPQSPDFGGGTIRGGAGLGLVGSVVGLAAHYRPVSACFAFYGAGWSVYTHIIARGQDVTFTRNTPMEIRFGIHGHEMPTTRN